MLIIWLEAYKLTAYLWLLFAVLALAALVVLMDILHFICKRIRFWFRLKKTGTEVRGLHPLWLFFSRPRKADFLVRGKSGITHAVRFVENWRRGTEYAVPSADRWYYAHHILLPNPRGSSLPIHLGFRKKWFGMDFRPSLEEAGIDAIPLWLVYPRPYRIVDRLYDAAADAHKAVEYELVTTAVVDGLRPVNASPYEKTSGVAAGGIRLVDGSTIIGMLTRDTPEF